MRFILAISLLSLSMLSFADSKSSLGENGNPQFSSCLKEDSCPSQKCSNSCAMVNSQQNKQDVGRSSNAKSKKPSTANQ